MKNIIYTITAISLCLIAGKIIYHVVGGLPASLYGMVIYCLLLQIGWLSPGKINTANQWGIKNMGVCFIPAAVGVVEHFELIKNHGFSIIIIVLFTTFALITFVGVLAEKYLTTTLGKPKPESSANSA